MTTASQTIERKLDGQVAIVTGAARGIGAGIAIALARAGVHVAVNDIGSPTDTVTACRAAGVDAIEIVGDVSDEDAVQEMVRTTVDHFGRLDIAISNAAFSDRELFYRANMDGFRKTIAVTMWGPYYLARYSAEAMIAGGRGGNLVFISSPHAYMPIPGATAYNMSKAAVDQLAKTAAVELAEHRIRSNIIHPGWTDTPGERKFFSEDDLQNRGSALPFGRLANADDISRGVVFLVDPGSEYITGATLSIDGGIVLPFGEMHRVRDRK